MNIFLVEDSVSIRRLLVRRLRQIPGVRIVGEAAGEAQALALIKWTQPDLVMTDLSLTDGSGLHLLGELRGSGYKGRVAVLTSQEADVYRKLCLDAGADAFYDKASALETMFDDLENEALGPHCGAEDRPDSMLRDGLTGLYNEAALRERLDQSARAAMRDGVTFAVYVLRLEGLKALPTDVSNQLAVAVAQRLREACSDADIVARRTFTQFCVVMTQLDDARQVTTYGERLLDLTQEAINLDGRNYQLDAELGVALFPTGAMSSGGLLTLAEASAFGAFHTTH